MISILYIFTLFGIAFHFRSKEGFFSTVVVFGLSAFVYYMAIPLEMITLKDYRLSYADKGWLYISEPNLSIIAFLGYIALISFSIGYKLSRYNPLAVYVDSHVRRGSNIFSHILLSIVSLVALFVIFPHLLAQISTYSGNVEVISNNSVFSFVLRFAYIALCLYAAHTFIDPTLVWRHKFVGILAIVSVIAFGMFSKNKDPLLLGFLALGSLWLGRRSYKVIWFWVMVIAIVIVMPLAVIAFSLYRAEADIAVLSYARVFGVFRAIDAGGPFISLILTLEKIWESVLTYKFGATYLKSLVIWIPQFLWENRPLDLAEEFARQNINNWSPGKGLGYSLLAEALQNFSWLGVFIQYSFIGWLWGKGWRYLQNYIFNINPSYFRAIYVILGYYLLIIMHRGPTSQIIVFSMQTVLPLVIISLFWDNIYITKGRAKIAWQKLKNNN